MSYSFPLIFNRGIFALASLLLSVVALPGQTTNVSVSPVPKWVDLCEWEFPANKAKSEKSEGFRYLLYERQEHPQRKESFVRVIKLMENETGVQDSGSLSFSFDPAFQELFLNRVAIHRDGKVMERLGLSKVRNIQTEPELDDHVLTGKQKALLFVEDLRVGDVLEFAYTIRGANPILDSHFAMRFVVQSSVATDRQRFRVLWPSVKSVYLRKHLLDAEPHKETSGELTDYRWDFAKLEGIPYEDALPAGYEPYPYIELSDFRDWARVVDWALPLYSSPTNKIPEDLDELITKWQKDSASDEEKARLALNFVQDEMRYTGIELGPDSYKPANPLETFRLRYGDCKAKVHFLCTMLREMKIEAYPALVSTYARENVAKRLPSPFAFDHVIVKVLLDGKVAWLDPTRSQQGGLLWDRYLTPMGKALLIKTGSTDFEDIPPSRAKALERVTSTFKLANYDSPVVFTVHTTHHGSQADSMREYLARNDAKEISKEYLNFYARYYPGIREARPFEVKDQRLLNVLELTEHYEISELWQKDKSSQRLEADFYADGLEKMLPDPDVRLRKMPLRVPYPLRHEQELVVVLPDSEWNIPVIDKKVEADAFSFRYRRKLSGSTVRFNYECETKAGVVPPEKVPEYLKRLEEMQELLGDSLERPDTRPGAILSQINWLMVVIAMFGAAAALAGGFWVWRSSRPTDQNLAIPELSPEDARLQGLGGWLILVGFGLLSALVWRPLVIAKYWQGYFLTDSWQAVALPGGSQYHPLYGPLLIFELLGNIFLFGLNIVVVCLFFAKRRLFPRMYVTFLVAVVVFFLIDQIFSQNIPHLVELSRGDSTLRQLPRSMLQAVIWCSYVLKSRRVKATFVR